MSFEFKVKNSLEKRKKESQTVLNKYSNRLPVIVEKVKDSFFRPSETLPNLNNNKFLVPRDITVSDFLIVLRKRIKLIPEEGLYIFVNNEIPLISETLDMLYKKHKDEDGFLYFQITAMETYG